jgi:SAM-dependent methyltransferase
MNQSNQPKSNPAAYDRWSKHYDRTVNSTVAIDELSFPPVWAHLTGRKILEIGCGTGRHTRKLARLGNQVTGIEVSRGMLEIAQAGPGTESVEFIRADFLLYPGLAAESFDAVICSLVLEHISPVARFFAKVAAVLRPGGEFYLSEIHPMRIAGGTQANFDDPETGENVRLVSYAHSADLIAECGRCAGLALTLEEDVFGTAEFARQHPGWEKYVDRPMIKLWRFQKPTAPVRR